MPRKLILPLAILTLAPPALPCLQDRDTLAQEARSDLSVVRVATGRFERNPPLYYRLRLDRLKGEIPSRPENLNLYDDAGVAADRLGLGDEAIDWMARKRRQMESMAAKGKPVTQEDWYRYHANLGTFLIHRWIKEGANPKRLREAQRARDEIAKAIRIKPNAHFGREWAQLAVMDWLLDVRKHPKREAFLADYLLPKEESRRFKFSEREPSPEVDRAIKGLLGLVALGNAWESFDVFGAVHALLTARSDHALAHLVALRTKELAEGGKRSFESRIGEKVEHHVPAWASMGSIDDDRARETEAQYAELRREADAWHAQRTAYMEKRLKAGRHPDTDPTFWAEYREVPPPSLEPSGIQAIPKTFQRYGPQILASVAVAALGLALLMRRRRTLPR